MKMANRKNTVIYLILLVIISFIRANLDTTGIKGGGFNLLKNYRKYLNRKSQFYVCKLYINIFIVFVAANFSLRF